MVVRHLARHGGDQELEFVGHPELLEQQGQQ